MWNVFQFTTHDDYLTLPNGSCFRRVTREPIGYGGFDTYEEAKEWSLLALKEGGAHLITQGDTTT